MKRQLPDSLVDHHAHLFSYESHKLFERAAGTPLPPFSTGELLNVLDQGKVSKAAVLSAGYMFVSPDLPHPDMKGLRAENEWLARQVNEHPQHLAGFFSVNPLLKESHDELGRWAGSIFAGVKIHMANSNVDLRNKTHVEQLASVFEEANSLNLSIVIHLRTRSPDFGKEDAEIFIEEVLPRAPTVTVQVAHVAGWSGYDDATDSALAAFVARADGTNLTFDLSAVVKRSVGADRLGLLVKRIRAIGLDRILFGTDWPEWTVRNYALDIVELLPLDNGELSTILSNRARWTA